MSEVPETLWIVLSTKGKIMAVRTTREAAEKLIVENKYVLYKAQKEISAGG